MNELNLLQDGLGNGNYYVVANGSNSRTTNSNEVEVSDIMPAVSITNVEFTGTSVENASLDFSINATDFNAGDKIILYVSSTYGINFNTGYTGLFCIRKTDGASTDVSSVDVAQLQHATAGCSAVLVTSSITSYKVSLDISASNALPKAYYIAEVNRGSTSTSLSMCFRVLVIRGSGVLSARTELSFSEFISKYTTIVNRMKSMIYSADVSTRVSYNKVTNTLTYKSRDYTYYMLSQANPRYVFPAPQNLYRTDHATANTLLSTGCDVIDSEVKCNGTNTPLRAYTCTIDGEVLGNSKAYISVFFTKYARTNDSNGLTAPDLKGATVFAHSAMHNGSTFVITAVTLYCVWLKLSDCDKLPSSSNNFVYGSAICYMINTKLDAPVLTYAASERKLEWESVEGATSYDVYKDGEKVGTVSDSGEYTPVPVAVETRLEEPVASVPVSESRTTLYKLIDGEYVPVEDDGEYVPVEDDK